MSDNNNNSTLQKVIGEQKAPKKKTKKKLKEGIWRKSGDKVWKDETLEDWDKNWYTIFIGNLGNDVTDQILFSTFSKYESIKSVRVIKDKRSMKNKGYGFVGFSDGKDYLAALKDMNGKYCGNRPMKVIKSNYKDRFTNSTQSLLKKR